MVLQPTSPTRRYSDYRRAVPIRRKRSPSATQAKKAADSIASQERKDPPAHPNKETHSVMPAGPATDKPATNATPSSLTGALSRSGSLTDRLRSSWKGGVSSLLKKSQDNVRAEDIAKAKARKSKMPKPQAQPKNSHGSGVYHSKFKLKGKDPVELPTSSSTSRLAKRKATNDSKHTNNSSIIDSAYSPNSKQFRVSNSAPPAPQKSTEQNTSSTPQQGPSAFDDSSSDEDEDESPVLQRASSVSVGKPMLVRHTSNAAASQSVRREQSPAPKTGLSKEISADRETQDMKQGAEAASKSDEVLTAELAMDRENALRLLEGTPTSSVIESKPLPTTPTITASQISPSRVLVASPATYHDATPQSTPSTASTAANNQQGTPFTTPLSPLSALYSNPVSPNTAINSSRLSRTLSAPTPPSRNPNRRVTIRPSDLIITHSEHDHRLFRDSIITTPYPERGNGGADGKSNNRLSDIPDGHEGRPSSEDGFGGDIGSETLRPSTAGEGGKPYVQLLDPIPTSAAMSPHGPGDRDRFPSLTSSESLFLTLSIGGHPSLITTVEIEVPNSTTQLPSTPAALSLRKHTRRLLNASSTTPADVEAATPFDDASLFTALRAHYNTHLLPFPRRLLFTRTLSHATLAPNLDLDATSFLAHLSTPSIGAQKTAWLLWLRNHQPSHRPTSANTTGTTFSKSHHHHARNHSILSHLNSPTGSTHTHTHSSTPIYPRMPFQRGGNDSFSSTTPPHITLHYRFNILTISLAALLSLLLGALAIVLWVLVGVPGLGIGEEGRVTGAGRVYTGGSGGNTGGGGASYGGWHVDSQMRVLTALVLGGGVAGGGLVVVGLWVLGGWVLL
ncbi:uncharacterized protein HMPREF1541_03091 [Cyphellophora europaea CBS 101466]|uniref:Uncharacterized protein n=1 Tax=Cyphellophora europaea (strain CBS 101466) TaxID=1220924 RepID=W2RXA9_CYPE1|nr:uncharacterized protein HMPREF1541_03091 [Cyphellophora europaea CBS 101466]ETN41156.1 hypothetical protein HMPREF1541_03091 [Cyphellophora europaea CBS 101466]